MSQEMTVSFAGGLRVTAHYDGFEIATDQAVDDGGDGSAPQPYDLFLASLATCAGFYVLRFCQKRDLPTDGIRVVQSWEREEGSKRMAAIRLRIEVPDGFPDKYRKPLARAADQCSVKRTLTDPPEITTEIVTT
jgi:ribosomal protein S12 methylthiotransferase accessory factor